jgi:hypothetical protein
MIVLLLWPLVSVVAGLFAARFIAVGMGEAQ